MWQLRTPTSRRISEARTTRAVPIPRPCTAGATPTRPMVPAAGPSMAPEPGIGAGTVQQQGPGDGPRAVARDQDVLACCGEPAEPAGEGGRLEGQHIGQVGAGRLRHRDPVLAARSPTPGGGRTAPGLSPGPGCHGCAASRRRRRTAPRRAGPSVSRARYKNCPRWPRSRRRRRPPGSVPGPLPAGRCRSRAAGRRINQDQRNTPGHVHSRESHRIKRPRPPGPRRAGRYPPSAPATMAASPPATAVPRTLGQHLPPTAVSATAYGHHPLNPARTEHPDLRAATAQAPSNYPESRSAAVCALLQTRADYATRRGPAHVSEPSCRFGAAASRLGPCRRVHPDHPVITSYTRRRIWIWAIRVIRAVRCCRLIDCARR